jgi:hypothetical protein
MSGRNQWEPTTAIVFSCDWAFLNDEGRYGPVGWHKVVYSYTAGGERYSGEFSDYGSEDEEYFGRNDTIEIRYDPAHPARSYYPALRTRTRFHLICTAVGFTLAIIVIFVRLLVFNNGR